MAKDEQKKPNSGRKRDQKMKAYLVYDYLMRNTDANHVATGKQIEAYLQNCGIPAERRSIYKDIEEINKAILLTTRDNYGLPKADTIEEAEELLKDEKEKTIIYDEHRKAVASGQVPITSESFVTAFHRRVFDCIMTLEESDGGFDFSLLGEYFSMEEMGRLARLEQARRSLSENGTSVLRAAAATLEREREHRAAKDAPPLDSIQMILAGKRKRMKDASSEGNKP